MPPLPLQTIEPLKWSDRVPPGDVDYGQVWSQVHEHLDAQGLPSRQRAFLQLTSLRGMLESTALIAVPNDFTKDVVERSLREPIADALTRVLQLPGERAPVTIAVTVDPSMAGMEPSDATGTDTESYAGGTGPDSLQDYPFQDDPGQENGHLDYRGRHQAGPGEIQHQGGPEADPMTERFSPSSPSISTPSMHTGVEAATLPTDRTIYERPPQEGDVIDFVPGPRPEPGQAEAIEATRLNPKYVFERFVIGASNRFAHAAAVAVAEAPAKAYNPLFIYGESGLGKTHLLHAIGHEALQLHDGFEVLYVSSEKFTNELIRSIRQQSTEEFRNRYRSIDILMIDDIQFIAGKESTQEEFFHTFNELYQSGKQIIVSSDRHPKNIPTLHDRLRSRFEGGLIADVQAPDFEMRAAILNAKGQALGIHVPTDVLEYVARKVQSNIRELEGALNKIIALAQLFNTPIRMEIAAQALNDADLEARRAKITPEGIINQVTSHFKVSLAEIRGRGRSKDIVVPRQVAMYLLREETGASLVEIGQLLGGRDHSTVMHGIARMEKGLETDSSLRSHVNAIREQLYEGA